jgi:hypothetical protein
MAVRRDKIDGIYNPDPVQVFLMQKKGKPIVRLSWYGAGAVTWDMPLCEAIESDPAALLEELDQGQLPTELVFRRGSHTLHIYFKRLVKADTYKGSVKTKLFGRITMSWMPMSARKRSVIRLLKDLQRAGPYQAF